MRGVLCTSAGSSGGSRQQQKLRLRVGMAILSPFLRAAMDRPLQGNRVASPGAEPIGAGVEVGEAVAKEEQRGCDGHDLKT